jgi:hypothetical protein
MIIKIFDDDLTEEYQEVLFGIEELGNFFKLNPRARFYYDEIYGFVIERVWFGEND